VLPSDDATLENDLSFVRRWNSDMEGKKSKRGRLGEGRPTKRTTEAVAKIAEAVAIGLTDEEAALEAIPKPVIWHGEC
jgi:hypothetical protein